MSFYNLIPSCVVCNQGKSTKVLDLSYNPYHSDINELFHFELNKPLSMYTALQVNDNVEVSLVPEFGVNKDEFEKYVKTFHLKVLYNCHGGIIQELYDKAYEIPYYQNPENFGFLSERDSDYLERLLVENYTSLKDIEKRPMAKFMQDIWRQAKGVL